MKKENWTSKAGVILAVAGSAVGLGNFLRFPQQAAQNGGGAFMIPYFIALLLLGIPLMWVEWSFGRMGAEHDQHTLPEIFQSLLKKPFYKYLGVLGLFIPYVIFVYYTYIESWCLGYAVFSASGKYFTVPQSQIGNFFGNYLGIQGGEWFSGFFVAITFFLITMALNLYFLYGGITGGIEKLCNFAMPVLFVLGFVMMFKIFSLPNISLGMGFLWNPRFEVLSNPKVWLAAAGQIFFTLSVGSGIIQTYASYLKKNDDIALSGLTSSFLNEFAEVIMGGTIAIPAAVVFFGAAMTAEIAQKGTVSLGFNTLPLIFQQFGYGWCKFFGFIWFVLLFLAAITSSVSLAQPMFAFIQKRLNLSKGKAVAVFGLSSIVYCLPVILWFDKGFMDEMDFWGGTFLLVVLAFIELIIYGWVIGGQKGFDEINRAGKIRVPKIYRYIIQYIAPVYIGAILLSFIFINLPDVLKASSPHILLSRGIMVVLFCLMCLLVKYTVKEDE
ncbi:MAG: sodium-dependent transporter [Candidatus Wallbacteria bacterium]|nr:sodium-dependent transporter [Candidatus Wallbacteria bacterium]